MKTRALLILVACAACRGPGGSGLSGAAPKVAVAPLALAFGNIYVGAQTSQSVVLVNSGAGGDEVSWSLAGSDEFSVASASPFPIAGGGTVTLSVHFAPTSPGTVSGALTVVAQSGTFTVALSAAGLADLACAVTAPCDTATFDPNAGACDHAPAANGTPCVNSTGCLDDAQCQSGACVGAPRSCDDGNACTEDYCVPDQGCQHQDTSGQCQGTNPCLIYACDPTSGCTTQNAATGTPCGSVETSCQTAQGCFNGSCYTVGVPNGVPCQLTWEPCVDDATCQSGVCDSPTADAEVAGDLRWDAGLSGAVGPFAVDDSGASYFVSETPEVADGGAGEQTSISTLDACGRPLWTSAPADDYAGVLLDQDQAIAWTADGVVRGLSRESGTTLWETSLADAGFLGGRAGATGFAGAPALTAAGQVVFPVTGLAPGVWALSRDGQPAWSASAGGWVPASVAADAAGNVYVAFGGGASAGGEPPPGTRRIPHWISGFVRAFDPSGQVLMTNETAPISTAISAGDGFLFLGGDTALTFDGGVLYGPPGASSGRLACWSSGAAAAGLIDAQGRVLAPNQIDDSWQALGSDGAPLWDDAAIAAGAATLADDGSLYDLAPLAGCGSFSAPPIPRLTLVALDGDAGVLKWQTVLADSPPQPTAHLALTAGASLVFAGTDQVYAVFAGKRRTTPSSAPWYRAGANNANTSAANQ